MEQAASGGWLGPALDALSSVFDYLGNTPRRIARQKDAARADAITPGKFNSKDNSAVTFIVLTLVLMLLIIGLIVYAASRK